MHIAILSRNKNLYSIRRLRQEAKKSRMRCDVINPLDCQLIVDGESSRIIARSRTLIDYAVVVPRIGASITDYGLSVVKQFEMQGIPTINSSAAIAQSRDKLRCLQELTQAGLQVPATVLTRSAEGLRGVVEAVKGLPVVLKILKGTQGVGVMLVHTPISLGSVVDTLRTLDQDVIIQQFIVEGAGRDYRVFVVGNEVVAAMMRTAPHGEFRSNIHRGAQASVIDLPPAFKAAAIRAAKALGLHIAGVDLMESNNGPLIIEVNSSPGLEGIEKASGVNVAAAVIRHLKALKKKR